MNNTKIEWCTKTWNPVTGCLHGCPYCYARNFATRFGGHKDVPTWKKKMFVDDGHTRYEIETQLHRTTKSGKIVPAAFPFDFTPTFHEYRLKELQRYKTKQNIFVCSMADLFGHWVPLEWILKVFKTCKENPRHWYFFLTKNPQRYIELEDILPRGGNFWYGTTITKPYDPFFQSFGFQTFLSIEPIQEEFFGNMRCLKTGLVIIGAETGNRKGKVIPKKEWIESIVNRCHGQGIPVFLKNNLAEIWGEPLIQEYFTEVPKNEGNKV